MSSDELLAVAVCEAYADYLACSLKNHPAIGTSYARHLDRPEVFDPRRRRDPYRDCLPLSTGLWELRNTLGQSIVDELVVESLLDLRASPRKIRTFGLKEAALATIDADAAINAGASVDAIEDVFIQRGIL